MKSDSHATKNGNQTDTGAKSPNNPMMDEIIGNSDSCNDSAKLEPRNVGPKIRIALMLYTVSPSVTARLRASVQKA